MIRIRKYQLVIYFISIFFPFLLIAQNKNIEYDLLKVDKNAKNGFDYPYYLYIPKSLYKSNYINKKHTLLVVPNNTGTVNDSINFHENAVKKQILIWAKIGNRLNTVVMMPVFPRSKKHSKIYTHALDRDVLTTDIEEYKRLDLQLINMIKNARKELKGKKISMRRKFWITGFSASGMFANRFTFLHPELVQAAAIGSPGGWPLAPIKEYKNRKLRFPIGVYDIESITGNKFQISKLKNIPLFIYMGNLDTNDSVIYDDGYEVEDKDLIFELFGKTPMDRWNIIENLYKRNELRVTFKLYKGVKHTINNDMIYDVVDFFKKSINQK